MRTPTSNSKPTSTASEQVRRSNSRTSQPTLQQQRLLQMQKKMGNQAVTQYLVAQMNVTETIKKIADTIKVPATIAAIALYYSVPAYLVSSLLLGVGPWMVGTIIRKLEQYASDGSQSDEEVEEEQQEEQQEEPEQAAPLDVLDKRKQALEDEIKKSLAYQSEYSEQPQRVERITPELQALLAQGVVMPVGDEEFGQKGILGVNQAVNVVGLLLGMEESDYQHVISQISIDLEDRSATVNSLLILKAYSARKNKLEGNSVEDRSKAQAEINTFAEAIEETDPDELLKQTTLRDTSEGMVGLQQRFINTCGATSLQVLRGEEDPIYAHSIKTEENNFEENPLHFGTRAAQEQLELVDTKQGDPIAPLFLMYVLQTQILPLLESSTKGVQQQAENFVKWLNNEKCNSKSSFFASFAKTTGVPVVFQNMIKQAYPFAATGMNVRQTFEKSNQVARETSSDTYQDHQYYGFGSEEATPPSADDLEEFNRALILGRSVPVACIYKSEEEQEDDGSSEPGHEMIFVDIRSTESEESNEYEYLLYEPTRGKSYWISSDDLKKGEINLPDAKPSIISQLLL
ncbi:hypothetical protein JJB07_14425 [Tumebacillus sp. ITR2]|uniref:Peptidase C39-like domain-containing protein n=1 Tax=Tumebacillus amylolyticus TaxID=2801339 RepID=A0ABS1JC36_9BACL|nr:hypothetical protein [Tumebacillus amylolyticus]MBL0387833.1 hypothetical protein [Tumebacillus amylolyticus]